MQTIYVVNRSDNVGTAVEELSPGPAAAIGAGDGDVMTILELIPRGHKAALRDLSCGDAVVKYGAVIGEATADIQAGVWVHLHNMKSRYDERSSNIDARTGEIRDTVYE